MPDDIPQRQGDLDTRVRVALTRLFPRCEVVSLQRHTRWRPSWDAEVMIDGMIRRLNIRAEKGENYVSPLSLTQEAEVHHILERHGIPVPHVYGMLDDPIAIVMDIIPGQINLATAESDAARDRIRSQYIETLARMHRIPLEEFAAAGLDVPSGSKQIALNLYSPCEAIFRRRMNGRPFALMDFIWRWVSRNAPSHRERTAFVSADSGQFLFEGDQLTGLIDFEVGYLGDPLVEFAGLRLRDSTEPLGDIGAMMDHYESLTGDRLDKQSVEYHTAGFCAVNGFLLWPLAFDPDINDDYVAYLSFSVGTSRWAITAIAEALGISLDDVAPPVRAPLTYEAAHQHLAMSVSAGRATGTHADYEKAKTASLAVYLERANSYGRSIINDNLHDASVAVGRPLTTPEEAEQALVDLVASAGPEHDAALARYFHRWLARQDFLLRDCGASSFLTGIDLQQIAKRD